MKFVLIVFSLIIFFSADQTLAQSNSPIPDNWYCDERWKADLIFIGKAEEISDLKGIDTKEVIPADLEFKFHKTILFKVEKVYKGSGEKVFDEIFVHTVSQNSENPFTFKTDEKYLVYVKKQGVIPISKSWIYVETITPDGLTAPIAEATEKVAFLEKVYKIDFDPLRDLLGYRGDNPVKGSLISGRALRLVKPAYPKDAKKKKITGVIKVQVLIDERGMVVLAKTFCPFNQSLAVAAEQAARVSRFQTTMRSGKPVKVSGIIVYNFVP